MPEGIAHNWLTPEIVEVLQTIKGRHAAKKRITAIKVAFAQANEEPLKRVWEQSDTCSETIWYTKWQNDPVIKAVHEACYERCLDWRAENIAEIEAYFSLKRRESIAKHSAQAPEALANVMHGETQKGADRISAANSLLGWANPDDAAKVRPASPAAAFEQQISQEVSLARMTDDEIEAAIVAEIGEIEGGAVSPETGAAEDADPGGEAADAADA
jgi:hypothetical protein